MRASAWQRRWQRFFGEELWRGDRAGSRPAAIGLQALRFAVVLGQRFVADRLLLRATALAYVTALALIPLLALAVSLVDTLGFSEGVTRWLVAQVAAGSPAAVEWILRLLDGVNFRTLGPIGATLLFATTVLTVGNFERALNDIWGVRRQRNWIRRFPDYLAVVVIAPLLLGLALSLRTTLETQWLVQRLLEVPGLAMLYDLGLRHAPTLLLMLAFSFLYWFLPNTEVRLLSAALGGVVAALLFNAAQSFYLGFNFGAARYSALFGAFAVLPLFLVWIYVSWAIVLLGAEVAFAHQNLARYRRELGARPTTPAEREMVGVAVSLAVARAFDAGSVCNVEALAEELEIPVRTLRSVVAELEDAGIVVPRGGEGREGLLQLGRPAERIAVADVLAALRGRSGEGSSRAAVGRLASQVAAEIEQALEKGPAARSLTELVAALPASKAPAA